MSFLLYTRRGCHLCEAAEDMLAAIAPDRGVRIVDVDQDPGLHRRYGDRVPVLVRHGEVLAEGRLDEATLVRLVAEADPSG